MFQQIKEKAEQALKLQNKNFMDKTLCDIVEMIQAATHPKTAVEVKTYGVAKTYDSEAEMIADIQGVASPVFPLPDGKYSGPAFGPLTKSLIEDGKVEIVAKEDRVKAKKVPK